MEPLVNNQDIEKAIRIHDQVFGQNPKFSKVETWQNRCLFKIYFVDEDAFLALEKKENYTFHIWLLGSIKKHSGLGTKLFKELSKDVITYNIQLITVSTIPTKFPTMHAWLKKIGFQHVCSIWSDKEEKVNMKIESQKFFEYFI